MNTIARFLGPYCFIGVFLVGASHASGVDIETIVSGIAFERGKLRQGEFAITGKKTLRRASGEVIEVAFEDHGRVDFTRGVRFYRHDGVSDVPSKQGYRLREGTWIVGYVEDATYFYSTFANIQGIFLFPPDADVFRGVRSGDEGFFDPRTLGMAESMRLPQTSSFEDVFEEFSNDIRDGFAVESLGGGVFGLRKMYQEPDGPGSRVGFSRYVVDVTGGFSILESTSGLRFVGPDGKTLITPAEHFEVTPPDPDDPLDAAERIVHGDFQTQKSVGWEEIGGIWVPSSFRLISFTQEFDDLPDGSLDLSTARLLETRVSGKIDWISVNSRFDESEFHYTNFGVPRNTSVFDWRDGEWQLVDRIGDGSPVIESRYGPLTYGLGAVFVVLVCGTLWLAKRRLNA